MPDRDIVDAIDELVDWQMSNYENRSGYDHDVNQVDCPHSFCREPWHGLAITRRMQQMRRAGYVDPEYRHADDNSAILCPGSDFDGEFIPPGYDTSWTLPETEFPHDGTISELEAIHQLGLTGPRSPEEAIYAAMVLAGDLIAAATGIDPSAWQLPDDPHNPNAWLSAETPRWWRCDDTTGLQLRIEDRLTDGFEDFRAPDRIALWDRHWVLHINGEQIGLHPDQETRNVCRHGTSFGTSWAEIHAIAPPRAGEWQPVSGILDMAGVDSLRSMQLVICVPFGATVGTTMLQAEMLPRFTQEASRRWPGFCMDLSELTIETIPDRDLRGTKVIGTWRPNAVGGVLEGGHAHGREVDANVGHRVETVAPARLTLADFNNPPATPGLNIVTYERAAYDTVTRRWVYRPRVDQAALEQIRASRFTSFADAVAGITDDPALVLNRAAEPAEGDQAA